MRAKKTPAEQIVRTLGGSWDGTSGVARCPAHRDRVPSLSVSDAGGKPLVHCHAGCSQTEVITALRARGLWGRSPVGTWDAEQQRETKADDTSDRQRAEFAFRIWAEAQPAAGTPVEKYLRVRGISLSVPDSLRFHPGLRHRSGGIWPAMVALVTRGADDKPIGIHRTFLSCDGGDKAPVTPQKMMLGSCCGGVVRLGPATNPLMVGEGIETCLAAMQAKGLPAWAALSTSGLRSLDLPATVCDVIVLADGDAAGEAAAKAAGMRWRRDGRRVRIARPPAGLDCNDMLRGFGPQGEP
jgi:putative DNA primase/helicase